MAFAIFYRGVPIGYSELEHFDDGMGVAIGQFRPTPAYEQLRPVFRRYSEALGETSAHETDEVALQAFQREVAALRLEIRDSDGRVIPTSWVHVYDFEAEGGPDAYEVHAQISDRNAWDAIVSGRRDT
ncbi:MAG TPA: hypothetical protein VFK04_05020 [Gemmatimonadaceae bacterium]|nr:hypothetical protein [Gemmatimonadaceae bacterium]